MRPKKELARRHGYGSPGTLISGTPVEQMGNQWSFAAYYRSILMCSVLYPFFLRERTRHGHTCLSHNNIHVHLKYLVHTNIEIEE